jgi:hypothetical protein
LLRNGELLSAQLKAKEEVAAEERFLRNPRRRIESTNCGDNGPQEQVQMIQHQEAVWWCE